MKIRFRRNAFGVVIKLTRQEANDLFQLAGSIGGTLEGTVRETTDVLYDQLETGFGFKYDDTHTRMPNDLYLTKS